MFKTDLNEFLKFHKNLFGDDACLKKEKDLVKWFNRVEKNHENIRNKLGGVTAQLKIEVEKTEIQVSYQSIYPYVQTIYSYIPEYITFYNISQYGFCQPTFGKYKWATHIITWLSNSKYAKDEQIFKIVNTALSRLGEAWSLAKTEASMNYLTISTDPIAFVKLGNYGPDSGSCFSHGGINEIHKYVLGACKNTYVGIVSKNLDTIDKLCNVYTRFWGFSNPPYESFHTANIYPKTPCGGGTVLKTMELGFKKLIETDIVKVESGKFYPRLIYFNGSDSSRSYSKKLSTSITGVSLDDEPLRQLRRCEYCNVKDSYKIYFIDDQRYYCEPCCKNRCTRCHVSGEYTLDPIMFYDKDFIVYYISRKTFHNKQYFFSAQLGAAIEQDYIAKVTDGAGLVSIYHKQYLKKNKWRQCLSCDYWNQYDHCINCEIKKTTALSIIKK